MHCSEPATGAYEMRKCDRDAAIIGGKWLSLPTGWTAHFILKPDDPERAMRTTACGRIVLIGEERAPSSLQAKCLQCERSRSAVRTTAEPT